MKGFFFALLPHVSLVQQVLDWSARPHHLAGRLDTLLGPSPGTSDGLGEETLKSGLLNQLPGEAAAGAAGVGSAHWEDWPVTLTVALQRRG